MTHISPHTPEETTNVARIMHENGASDRFIGAMLMHHYHDIGDAMGASVNLVRGTDARAAVVVQPSGRGYPDFIDGGRPKQITFGPPVDVPRILPEE